MMSLTKVIMGMTSVVMLCSCAPTAQQSAELPHDHHGASHSEPLQAAKSTSERQYQATVKPGANISLQSVFPKPMVSGTYQTVQLELSEGYQDGVMTVSIEPSEGLTLFGGINSKTFSLSNTSLHIWDVDVKADADGVYFLNVFSQANGQGRSFSVRLDVGDRSAISQKSLDDAMPADGTLSDGGEIRILDADETIQ